MGTIRTAARAFRPFITDNLPASGVRNPDKLEILEFAGVIEDEVDEIRRGQTTDLILEKTWAALAARSTTGLVAGAGAEVVGDAGTHTDPVVGGTVSNSGRFRYSTSPAGWERIGGAAGQDNALRAEAAQAAAEDARDEALTTASAVERRVIGATVPLASGTAYGNTNEVRWLSSKAPSDSFVAAIETGCGPESATFRLHIGRPVAGDTSMEFVASYPFSAAPGRSTKTDLNPPIPAGCVVGLERIAGTWYYTTGTIPDGETAWWSLVPSAGTPRPINASTSNGLNWRYTRDAAVRFRAEAGYAQSLDALTRLGATGRLGWPAPADSGTAVSGDYAIVLGEPVAVRTLVTDLDIACTAAGTVKIKAVTLGVSGSDETGTTVRTKSMAVADGLNALRPDFWLEVGEALAIEGGGYLFDLGVNPEGIPVRAASGGIATGTVLATQAVHRFQVRVATATGLQATIGNASRQQILPNDPRLLISDAPPIKERSARRLRFERPLDDGQGFQHCAPGARVTFQTTSASVGFDVFFNGLVERDDARNYLARVRVDGAVQAEAIANTVGPNGTQRVSKTFNMGSSALRRWELIWPYADGMDLEGINLDPGAGLGAGDARPAKLFVTCTDSIGQGFSATSVTDTWPFLLGELEGAQVINGGYGGRQMIATDGLWAGDLAAAAGANATILLVMGANNCIAQGSVSAYKGQVAGWLTNARARAPQARIVCVGPFWCQAIEASPIPLDSYRTAKSEAVAESTVGNVSYINGKPLMANNSTTLNADLVHPNDAGHSQIAAGLSPLI